MILDEFDNNYVVLAGIIKILSEQYDIKMDLSKINDLDALEAYYEQLNVTKLNIINESEFNTYHTRPDYNQVSLIQEAIRIFLSEIAPKRLARRNKQIS